jgi:thiamine biosynthesis lipoprotein
MCPFFITTLIQKFIKLTIMISVPVFLSILLLSGCQGNGAAEKLYQQQLFSFGTLIDISILSYDEQQARQAIDALSTDFDLLHHSWHPWNPGPLSRINRLLALQAPFASDPSVLPLIEQAKQLSAKTSGLFNPAIGQLIRLWQFDQLENEQHEFSLPSPGSIKALLDKSPSMDDIIIEGIQLQTDNPAVALDFGAFAKGVAIDRAMEKLQAMGIHNALVNAGGDLKVLGSKNGRAWKIGIKNPQAGKQPDPLTDTRSQINNVQPIIASIELRDGESLFTSGDYERFFEIDGQHYHHIIDPRTGYPATKSHSVTILAKDAGLADAASTALFIAGPEHWQKIARQLNLHYVMLVAADNTIYLSTALSRRIKILSSNKVIIQSI